MKKIPADARCERCGSRQLLHYCYECKRWFCYSCEPDDICPTCVAQIADETASKVTQFSRHYYS